MYFTIHPSLATQVLPVVNLTHSPRHSTVVSITTSCQPHIHPEKNEGYIMTKSHKDRISVLAKSNYVYLIKFLFLHIYWVSYNSYFPVKQAHYAPTWIIIYTDWME